MTLEEWKIEQEDDDFMFRLANLSKHRTGLSVVVWIEANMGMKHVSPRMLFSNSTGSCLRPGDSADSLIPVSLDPENPKILLDDAVLNISTLELEAIKRWIVKNYRPLMRHWNMEIDTYEAIRELQRL
ncbi:MAG: hypothetical protein HDS46_06520 [Bacteroides sp.]|nr:hypothetical protein [Bacteroides sp.]